MKLRGADLLLPELETMYVREEKDGTFHLVDKPYEPEVEQEIRALAKERAVRELLCQVENQYAYASRDKEHCRALWHGSKAVMSRENTEIGIEKDARRETN